MFTVAFAFDYDWVMGSRLNIDAAALAAICKRHGVKKLSLFGSVLHGLAGPESDVDLLVEFLADRHPGYFVLAELTLELEAILGRPVDVRTPAELSSYFRDQIMHEALVQYAA